MEAELQSEMDFDACDIQVSSQELLSPFSRSRETASESKPKSERDEEE